MTAFLKGNMISKSINQNLEKLFKVFYLIFLYEKSLIIVIVELESVIFLMK